MEEEEEAEELKSVLGGKIDVERFRFRDISVGGPGDDVFFFASFSSVFFLPPRIWRCYNLIRAF